MSTVNFTTRFQNDFTYATGNISMGTWRKDHQSMTAMVQVLSGHDVQLLLSKIIVKFQWSQQA